jgi:2-amino-4-hydroxy-6-hydroxymethyldihydropteridine diphosphokinase
MARAGIALGSNLGESLAQLRAALAALRKISTPGAPLLVAPVYQTQPLDCPPGSPDFLNSVVEIGFDGDASSLLACTRVIEESLGRVRGTERNAPRFIDLDLLYRGDECVRRDELVLPHPRLFERRFVLQPLADIRPDLILPGNNRSIAEVLRSLPPDTSPPVRIEAAL